METGPQSTFIIKLNDKIVDQQKNKDEVVPNYSLILDYEAGDTITITVQYNWHWQMGANDYSVVVYAKQDLTIRDSNKETNMLHFDGTLPTGFVCPLCASPMYRETENLPWTPKDQKISSLY